MKRKHTKLRSVTYFLAICASVSCASACVLLMAGEYQSARDSLDKYNRQFEGWQACQQTRPAYYQANSEAVITCIKGLDQAQGNFWVKLPKAKLAAFFVIAGLGSATAAYLATWILVWLPTMCICGFIRCLAFCFRRKPKKPALSTAEGAEIPSRDTNTGDECPAGAPAGLFSPRPAWRTHCQATHQSEPIRPQQSPR